MTSPGSSLSPLPRTPFQLTVTQTLPLRYHYPNGRVYYTPLRVHMKELVNEIIADAGAKGYRTTRCKNGPRHIPGSTLLEPLVLDHDPDVMEKRQRCQDPECDQLTAIRCPHCNTLCGSRRLRACKRLLLHEHAPQLHEEEPPQALPHTGSGGRG